MIWVTPIGTVKIWPTPGGCMKLAVFAAPVEKSVVVCAAAGEVEKTNVAAANIAGNKKHFEPNTIPPNPRGMRVRAKAAIREGEDGRAAPESARRNGVNMISPMSLNEHGIVSMRAHE